MTDSIFIEMDFVLLIMFSLIVPVAIYSYLMWRKSISRRSVLLFACVLILVAGIDVFLLQRLSVLAASSPSLLDNVIFSSEMSVALYLFPLVFAGIGTNMITHELIYHLTMAERQYRREES